MSPAVDFLLNDCFWTPYDAGISPDKTPLLTGLLDGAPLGIAICNRFDLSPDQADTVILAARREVEL